MMIEVFATSRCVRAFYESFRDANVLPPKAITIAELEQKALLVPNRALVDEDMRVLLMQEATHFTTFELLHIEREFFTFLKNSTYLFRFFEELAHEHVSLEALQGADTYALYDEHLLILQTLLKHYKALLSKHALFDRIVLPECYTLNTEFIRSLGSVTLHLEGFLSRFEMELFTKIATLISLHVSFSLTSYNQKVVSLFHEYGFELKEGYGYLLDLTSKTILQEKKLETPMQEVQCFAFASRLAQIGFVHSTIARLIEEGLKPEEIVVVLPDERFSEHLRLLDQWHNLNFAMGIPVSTTLPYQKLAALEKALRYGALEDELRLSRFALPAELFEAFKSAWYEKLSADKTVELLKALLVQEGASLWLQESFFEYEQFLKKAPALRLEQHIKLFLNRLNANSIDDVRGGKVTVQGVLETRGIAYKGVIVVDFNDDFIPKRSQKDLFLSSSLRSRVGLPTRKDRENLQRYYYHRLFQQASHVMISFVQNDLSMPSRFLDELGFKNIQFVDEALFAPLVVPKATLAPRFDVEFIDAPYDLKARPLSATKLKTLLTCRRQFYFRYVLKLKEAKMPSRVIDEQSLGVLLHTILENVVCDALLLEPKRLKALILEAFKAENAHEVWAYFAELWSEKLDAFVQNEIKRYEEGYRIFKKESSHQLDYNGFRLEGKIDRIDVKDAALYVMDYKSGKVPSVTEKSVENCKDFQLVFYDLFAKKEGPVASVGYYDLKEGVIVQELFLEPKRALLDTLLKSFEVPINGYEKCDDASACRLCPYVLLCQKEELVG
jgi:hypothetical protein